MTVTTLAPGPSDAESAAAALSLLSDVSAVETAALLSLSDHRHEVSLPPAALSALREVLESFADGDEVTIVRKEAELTSQQAADLLNVSRPYLVRLLDDGQIPYRRVGRHRRVNAQSLLDYKERDDARRRTAADALTTEISELGLQ